MLVIRNTFHLKFGKAKEGVALMKEAIAIQKRLGSEFPERLLTDITGPFYTLVLELTVPSLGEYEAKAPKYMSDKKFQANYRKFTALVESGSREIYKVVE